MKYKDTCEDESYDNKQESDGSKPRTVFFASGFFHGVLCFSVIQQK